MPIEAAQLKDQHCSIKICQNCLHTPFEPAMRGTVQRHKRNLFLKKQHYCAVICSECMEIVGWESPINEEEDILHEQAELDAIPKNQYPLHINKIWKYEINKQKYLKRLKTPNN